MQCHVTMGIKKYIFSGLSITFVDGSIDFIVLSLRRYKSLDA